uniref:Uncharacterized protein n=1 Tax=Brassica oleracea TaxID=3712 RepID=A0A3P6GKH9_BRAOL|nr:unnamed protein product [Brassica oleracea]
MGDRYQEKNMENPDVTRVGYADGSNQTMDWAVGLNGWSCPKRHEQVVSDPYGSVYDLLSQDKFTVCLSQGPRPDQELRMVLVKPRRREGSVSERLCNVWLDDARDELVIVYETVKKLCIGSHAGEGVNPEETEAPQFVRNMEGKTYKFQVRVSSYNFTANHQTFTISRILSEGGHFPYPEFVDNGGDDDNGDDNPLSNSVPVKLGAGGTSKVDGAAAKLKKARKA